MPKSKTPSRAAPSAPTGSTVRLDLYGSNSEVATSFELDRDGVISLCADLLCRLRGRWSKPTGPTPGRQLEIADPMEGKDDDRV